MHEKTSRTDQRRKISGFSALVGGFISLQKPGGVCDAAQRALADPHERGPLLLNHADDHSLSIHPKARCCAADLCVRPEAYLHAQRMSNFNRLTKL